MGALSQFLKKFLFIILGLVIGGLVNYGIIILTSSLAPRGVDSSDIESIKQNIQHYTPIPFFMAFFSACSWNFGRCIFGTTMVKIKIQSSGLYRGWFLFSWWNHDGYSTPDTTMVQYNRPRFRLYPYGLVGNKTSTIILIYFVFCFNPF